jgi:hypothetical protein
MDSPWIETRTRRAIRVARDGWIGFVMGSLLFPAVSSIVWLASAPEGRYPSLRDQLIAFGKGYVAGFVITVMGMGVYALSRAASLQRKEARAELQRRDQFDIRFELADQKPLREPDGTVTGYILQFAVTNLSSAGVFSGRAQWVTNGRRLGDPWHAAWAQSQEGERQREIGLHDTDTLQVAHVLKSDQTDSGWIVYPKLPGDADSSDVIERAIYRLRPDHKDPIGDTSITVRVRRADRDAYEEKDLGFELNEAGEPTPIERRSARGPTSISTGSAESAT